ncbi:MAG: CHAT domain-containing protein [Terriglobia bacterium]
MSMRTVTLEFLRHGPPHNQLLSPLTRYMVLCGNHQAADVSVGFEHAQFLTKLRAFQYRETDVNREMQTAETAAQMSSILAAVPGLVAELADSAAGARPALTHLRLILSANELALLPFELANAGSAFPGAGQSLALQPHVPICITREVRRVSAPYLRWPSTPKILFAASSAGGPIPLDAHMLALRRAIDPWLFHFEYEDEEVRRRTIDEHIRVLTDASVQALVKECASGNYTHIHLLAHGVERESEYGRRYGLALHDSQDPAAVDFVEGSRLAALLRPSLRAHTEDLALPTVVTLASCDSGSVGSVVGAGASIAHALHEAGIPLVVASQFPLSFAGSVVMAEVLYEGLLEGGDPRAVLVRLRRELVARVPRTHDWASVVAYASFPQDLERQLSIVRIRQASRRIEAALNHADFVTKGDSERMKKRKMGPELQTNSKTMTEATLERLREATLERLREATLERLRDAIRRMEDVLSTSSEEKEQQYEVYGLLASAEKRRSQVFWRLATHPTLAQLQTQTFTGLPIPHYASKAIDSLRKALEAYRRCFALDRSQAWALVQAMALTAVLDGGEAITRDEWELSRLLSEEDLKGDDRQRRAWARSNLIELELLAGLVPVLIADSSRQKANIADQIKELLRAVGINSPEIHSTRRQLERYEEFFYQIASYAASSAKRSFDDSPQGPWPQTVSASSGALDLLPETTRFE